MKPLYELCNIHSNLAEIIDSVADEDLDKESINLMMANLGVAIKDKCTSIAGVIKNFEHHIDGIKKIEEAAYLRRKRIERNLEQLKSYMLKGMIEADINKIISPQFDISVKSNPLSVDIYNESLLPKEYFKEKVVTTVTIDKNKIKEDIKTGLDVPGATLTQNKRLEIR